MKPECGAYRPRLSIDLTVEQQKKIQLYFPHGMIRIVFSFVVDDLLEMIEKYGAGPVLGSFIEREVKVEDICRGNNKRPENVNLGDGVQGSSGNNKEHS